VIFVYLRDVGVCLYAYVDYPIKIIVVLLKVCCYPMGISRKWMDRSIGRVVNQCDCCSILYNKICLCV
jgi:hypothetical protein